MKMTGLKKAVGSYKKLNNGGAYSPHYGYLMYDKSTGELWTDEFYDYGQNNWINYNDDDVINIGKLMTDVGINVNMQNVKQYITQYITAETGAQSPVPERFTAFRLTMAGNK